METAQNIIAGVLSRAQSPQMGLGELMLCGDQLKSLGRVEETVLLYKTWLAFHADEPTAHMAYFNYSVLLSETGDRLGSMLALQESVKRSKSFLPPYINLGNNYEAFGQPEKALATWGHIVDELSQVTLENINYKCMALNQAARFFTLSDLARGEEQLEKSLSVNPHQSEVLQQWISLRQRQIKWPVISPVHSVSKEKLLSEIAPLSLACYVDDPMFQLGNAYNYNKNFVQWPKSFNTDEAFAHLAANKSERLRVGYISSDLRDHAVGYSMTEVIELHDREKFEVFCYYCGSVPFPDATQNRIKAATDHWFDVSNLDDDATTSKIFQDGIHILVDLNGYTKDAKTKVFSRRPAPININWFGYPGTMGSPYHHYIIADDVIIPQEYEKYYSERVLRLPCYQPNDRKRFISPNTPKRSDAGLPEDAIVFCSLNGFQKLNLATYQLWLKILLGVPGSVLWLLSDLQAAQDQLREIATSSGVSANRIVFTGSKPNADHLARYALADLFLDNMPYGAHTTAADSLWMGVPVLTLPGHSFASRVCASLVRAAGLDELICKDKDDYVARGIALGKDKSKLSAMRRQLIETRGTNLLFNSPHLVKKLEEIYGAIWKEFVDGKLPRPDLRNLEIYNEIGTKLDHEVLGLIDGDSYPPVYLEALNERNNFSPIYPDVRLWKK